MSDQPSNPKKRSAPRPPLNDVLNKHWDGKTSLPMLDALPPSARDASITSSFIAQVEAAAPRWVLLPVPITSPRDANRFMNTFRRRNLDATSRRHITTPAAWSVYVRVKPTVDD